MNPTDDPSAIPPYVPLTPGPADPMAPPSVPPGPEPAAVPGSGPGPAPSGSPATGAGAWPGWEPDRESARAARRAERAARREARRGERGLGAAIWGLLLILFGAGLLAAQLLPGFDWDLAWPLAFMAIGLVLVAGSIRRAPADGA